MAIPKKIKKKGSDSTYILESIAPNKNGEKYQYMGNTYIKEDLPPEYVMFEGVTYRRTMSVDQHKKILAESVNKKNKQKLNESIGADGFKDPTREEMETFLSNKAKQYEASDFDVQSAIYWYASDYHSGQTSNLYSVLSTSEYTPSRAASGIQDEGDIAEMLYSDLEDQFGRA